MGQSSSTYEKKEGVRVESIQKFKLAKPDQCHICLEPLSIDKKLRCGHTFCRRCIVSWYLKENTCPMCRQNIKDKDLERERKKSNAEESSDPDFFLCTC